MKVVDAIEDTAYEGELLASDDDLDDVLTYIEVAETHEWHPDSECRWHVHLHAKLELRRHRQLHLQGQRR